MKKSLIILTGLLVLLSVCALTSSSLAAESTKRISTSSFSAPTQAAHVTADALHVAKPNGQVKVPPVRLDVRPQSMKGTFTPAIRIPQGDARKAQILQEMAQPVKKPMK